MQRTRSYYLALGYDTPYRWAHFEAVPFCPMKMSMAEAEVAIVTTAAPFQADCGDQGPGAPYNAAAKFYKVYEGSTATMPDLRISHIAIDRDHTTAEDIGTYFPLAALAKAEREGRIGKVAEIFFGLPTNRSHRTTLEVDCPDLVNRVKSRPIDAVLLVPNCPVCHQSVALAARALEEAGIPTVIMGCARDIIEHAGVPRFLFSDFPLGNAAGQPRDEASQQETLALALDLLARAEAPRTTWVSPQIWKGKKGWKADYANPDKLTFEEIAARRKAFDAGKAEAARVRQRDGS
ncbi:glycine/sarcosine/betaine reductase selenoprotein B family protein [Alphaproteobacteria bacterium LSUCC0684]